jgi:hypothetical protein
MRESLESWLASLADMDQERVSKKALPLTSPEPVPGSWDPQAHDVDNDATRMIT